jgi:hypothetical protein
MGPTRQHNIAHAAAHRGLEAIGGSLLGQGRPGRRPGAAAACPACRRSPGRAAWCAALVALLFTTLATELVAGSPIRWRWSNPAPHGANVFDMAYGLGLTVQVGERGQIYTSEDLRLWHPRASGTTNALRGVAFLGNRLLVTGERGTVLWADSLEDFQRLELGTADWLEGVAASSSLAVAVGDNGAAYSSTTGTNWTRENTGFTDWLRGVAAGNNLFVAVGERGRIATRAANGNWSVETSGTTQHLNRVAFIGTQFWAVGDAGTVLVGSSNGKTWTPHTGFATTNALYAVAGTNDYLVIVGDREVRLQNGSGGWTDEVRGNADLPAPNWTYYAASWEGSLHVIAGRSGMTLEGIRTNATAPTLWTQRDVPLRNWLWDLLSLPAFYVAAGDRGTVMTSPDGVNWELELVPDAATNSVLLGIGGTTNGLVAAGSGGRILFSPAIATQVVSTNVIAGVTNHATNTSSTLAIDWLAMPTPTANDLQAVAVRDGRWVVGGAAGTVLTSPDGTNWSAQASGTTAFLSGAAVLNGLFVLTGDRGTILTSGDGTNWFSQTSGTTNWVYRVRAVNGRLVAVGENGVILTSPNGTNWTGLASGTTRLLHAVDYLGDAYYAVGAQGTVLQSGNLTTWTNVGTLTQKSLYGVAGRSNQIVTVGIEGVALRSLLSPSLEPVAFTRVGRAAGQNLLLLSGRPDQRVTLERSTTLTNWVDGVTLELIDRSGTLLLLEAADTNDVPREFFRGRMAN